MSEPLRFLILEDNPDDAELTQFELQKAGMTFTSKVVTTEEDFVRGIRDFSPDLILSDYDLPRYTGAQALAEAKRSCPDTPFILVTGAVTEDRAIDILTRGARDYVLKNRLDQRLAPAVRRALAEAEEHRARKQAEAELREAYRTLEERVKIRTAELEAEVATRKKTEAALRDSERRLVGVLESMPEAFVGFDANLRYTYLNRNAERLQAASREELIGKDVREIYPDPESYKTISLYERVIAEGTPITATSYHAEFDGWVEVSAFPTPNGVSVFYRDVSAKVKAEEALKRSEARWNAAIENLGVGAIIATEDEQVIYWNPAAREMHGFKSAVEGIEPLEETPNTFELWTPDGGHMLTLDEWPMRRIKRGETVRKLELRLRRPGQGWEKIVSYSGAMVETAGGELLIFLSVYDLTEQRKAEAELRKSDVRLRRIAQAARIGFFEWNASKDTAFWSPEHYELFGYKPDSPITWDRWLGSVHPEDRERVAKNAARLLERGRVEGEIRGHKDEYRFVHPDGRVGWLASHVSLDKVGGETIVRGTVHDITKRKRSEEDLERMRNILAEAQNIAQLGSFEYVAATGTTVWSEEEYRIYGLDPAGQSPAYDVMLRKYIHPDDAAVLHETFTKAMQSHSIYELEHRIVRPDGSVRWVYDRAQPYLDEQGRLLRYVGATLDITDRKAAELAIRESETRFRLALKNSPVVVAMQDSDLVYRWAYNTRTRRSDDIIGKRDADIFAPEDTPLILEAKKKVLRTGEVIRHQQWLTSNGQRVFLDCYYEPLRDSAGKIIGIGTAAVNLTEQKRAEEALKEANQELEAFSYSVSHDLRAPLRHISGYAGMLRKHLGDATDEVTTRYVTGITRAANNMATLIDDLLAFSRIGRNGPRKKKFRFEDLVAEVVREIENEAAGRDIEWDIGDFPEVYGDPSLLKLALVNLVSNAVKFTGNEKQAQIALGCTEEKGEFVFFVKDNGVGFDMKYVDKLFGVFHRLHTQTEFEGTGIGLANVKRIISRHGGKTWAEGAVGQGATFFFMIPRWE